MFNIRVSKRSLQLLLSVPTAAALLAADAQMPRSFEATSGSVKFIATTNIGAISIHGESKALMGRVHAQPAGGQINVDQLEAHLDPKTLSTGMSLRDDHMRNKIFTVGDAIPELRFAAAKIQCPHPESAKETACQVQGTFTMRGISKPFAIALKVRQAGQGAFRVSGEGSIKLTAFGVEPPCQLGVCVTDDVQLKLEFQARELQQSSQLAEPKGGGR